MPDRTYQTLLADVETDGLLDQLTRVHTLNIREFETGLVWRFRRNENENTIQDGLDMLCDADSIVFHNGIGFDMLAIVKVYPDFDPPGVLEDTFIYSQLLFSNIKESDFVRWHKGKLAGKLLGSHSLEAWGQRFDLAKGDYKIEKEKEAKALGITDKDEITKFVWGIWNQEMDDYCDQDVVVLTKLWAHCLAQRFPQDSIDFEHATAEFAVNVGIDGIPFDIPAAEKLVSEMQDTMGELVDETKKYYGSWFAPGKQVVTRMLWDDPDGKNKKKTYAKPQEKYGENTSRAIWAAVDVSKRNTIFKSLYKSLTNKKTGVTKTTLNYDKFEGAAFCKTQLKEFKPTSRNNIVDRYTVLYDWQPVDFTDGGAPSVNDDVLRNLIGKFPMAEELAEIFYYSKRIGMILTGPNAWLKQVKPDGKIHHRLNMLGTGTGRASHSYPNMSQVMAVMIAKVLAKDGKINDKFILPDGSTEPGVYNLDGSYKKTAIVKGRKGDHGFECRSMFYVPKGWKQVGTDLSGIQLRCLAAVSAPFDNGYLIDVILNGDIHELNQTNTGLETRDKAKTLIYGCVTMDTLALTNKGWKKYEEISVGDLVLTYNQKEDVKEWKPVLEKVFYKNADVTRMHNKHNFSIKSTPNHRWFINERRRAPDYRRPYLIPKVKTTDQLNTESNIICNAPLRENRNGLGITQNKMNNITKRDTDWVALVLTMTQGELRSFLMGFMIADGHYTIGSKNSGNWNWCQNVGNLQEAALLASFLSHDGKISVSQKNGANSPMHVVHLNTKPHVTMPKMQKEALPNQDVWCIRTENESWVIRQGDCITITGNTIFGAGDVKAGSIVDPLATENEQRVAGKALKLRLMQGLPGLDAATKKVKREAKRGFITGLDGRRIFIRSPHSALNFKLQGDEAVIAKRWCLLVVDKFIAAGYKMGWDHDFVIMLFSHDEIQVAVRDGMEDWAAKMMIEAAQEAGEFYDFAMKVDAESKIGMNWAECH